MVLRSLKDKSDKKERRSERKRWEVNDIEDKRRAGWIFFHWGAF